MTTGVGCNVCPTLAPSHLMGSSRSSGSAANTAVNNKKIKYACVRDSFEFLAFAVEIFGTWSPDAKKISSEISKLLKEKSVAKMIPASQRPDGTWRKPRRVKDGYVPQEEVPLYESKGRQFASRKQDYPVGLTPEIIAAATKQKKPPQAGKKMTCVIPGLLMEVDKTKKKKKSGNEEVTELLSKITFKPSLASLKPSPPTEPNSQSSQDPVKKLRGLKKKLRDIDSLLQKIKSGELKNPEKDQLDKISRQAEIEREIALIEAQV